MRPRWPCYLAACVSFRLAVVLLAFGGRPSIRAKALSRDSSPRQCFSHRVPAREGGGPRLWNSHGESFLGETNRFTNHRYGLNLGHDSSIRIPVSTGTRAPNQSFGLACADQGHPRAALDMNDRWIRRMGAQHPVESYGQLPRRCHFRHPFRLLMTAMQIFRTKLRIVTHSPLRRF